MEISYDCALLDTLSPRGGFYLVGVRWGDLLTVSGNSAVAQLVRPYKTLAIFWTSTQFM